MIYIAQHYRSTDVLLWETILPLDFVARKVQHPTYMTMGHINEIRCLLSPTARKESQHQRAGFRHVIDYWIALSMHVCSFDAAFHQQHGYLKTHPTTMARTLRHLDYRDQSSVASFPSGV